MAAMARSPSKQAKWRGLSTACSLTGSDTDGEEVSAPLVTAGSFISARDHDAGYSPEASAARPLTIGGRRESSSTRRFAGKDT
jgi:hypothetical protein